VLKTGVIIGLTAGGVGLQQVLKAFHATCHLLQICIGLGPLFLFDIHILADKVGVQFHQGVALCYHRTLHCVLACDKPGGLSRYF